MRPTKSTLAIEYYRAGEEVTIIKDDLTLALVKRVTRRYLELSDGTKWQLDGMCPYPRPKHRSWRIDFITHTTSDHRIEIYRRGLVKKVKRIPFEDLSVDQLEEMLSITTGYSR